MKKEIVIENRSIGPGHPPYIIAEISGNHNKDIEKAFRLIEIAKESGADAVKFQTYLPESLTIDSDRDEFLIKSGPWKGKNLFELYKESYTPWDWFPKLFNKAKEVGITAFSSPFDKDGVNYLDSLHVPAFKIASNEFTDWLLLESALKKNKPLILSTGTVTKKEIEETLSFLQDHKCDNSILLYCVSSYPTEAEDAHLKTLLDISSSFDVITGISDHSTSLAIPISAVALGACVIEKHFTISRNDGGPDSHFSLEPSELKQLCIEARLAWRSLGDVIYGGETNLKGKNIFTRQLWATKTINVGDLITEENVRSIRAPSDSGGVSTMNYKNVFGKKACKKLLLNSPITLDAIG